MGNIASVGAAVFIQLDNPGQPIYGGSNVTGRVYLSVDKSSVTADFLNVKLYGKEDTKVEYQVTVGSGDNARIETRHAYETRIILAKDCVLARFPGSIAKGRYEFPFSITVPFGIPGKQGTYGGSNYFVIDYFLEARMFRHGLFESDVKNHIELFIVDPPSIGKTPSFVPPVTKPINFCCCFNQGNITILVNVDDTDVNCGDEFNVDYAIYNESDATVKAVEIRVDQSMRFTAMGHYEHQMYPLYRNRIEGDQIVGADSKGKRPDGAPVMDAASMFSMLQQQMRRITFPFPLGRSTVNGQLGSVTHALVFRIATKFCVDDPEVVIPLRVINGPRMMVGLQPAIATPMQLPPDWSAQTFPPVNLVGQVVTAGTPQMVPAPGMTPMGMAPAGMPPQGVMMMPVTQQPPVAVYGAPGGNASVSPYGGGLPAVQGGPPQQQMAYAAVQRDAPPMQQPGQTQVDQFAPQGPPPGIDGLLNALRAGNQFIETEILKEWLASNDWRQITPDTIGPIFQSIRGEYSFSSFAEEIGKASNSQMSVKHVAAAARVAPEAMKGRICTSFAPYVYDKPNAQTEFRNVGMSDHTVLVVNMYYK